jgi:hypothetical protein
MIPPELTTKCSSGDPAGVESVADLERFSLGQEAALQTCEAKRSALVDLIKARAQK